MKKFDLKNLQGSKRTLRSGSYATVLAVVVLMALLLTGLGSVLYDLQINNGATYRRQSQYKIAETETVEAGRGQILDRNGRVLVSDKAV